MKIILIEDVASVGKAGDLVNASDGYARNFLIPRGLAREASGKNMQELERERETAARRAHREKKTAQALVEVLEGVTCHISRKVGQQDKLFGSVTSKDIGDALVGQGIEVDRRDIILAEPIKSLGEFSVKIKVHPGMSADIKVVVTGEV
ncbi:MAG: 50S ribosomal protein L9 [Candidatus Altiarchaeota archaeon]|nr:50S ribosomal protein L9 [Candidatus Altiarchaeota archaeon]